MQKIVKFFEKNKTAQKMILNTENSYNKLGVLEQIHLDTELSSPDIYNELTTVVSFRVPMSHKEELKTEIKNYLKKLQK